MSQARQMAESRRYDGVRVVEDEFTDDAAVSRAKRLFVSRSDAADPAPRKRPTTTPRRRPPQEIDRPRRGPTPKSRKKNGSSVYRIVGTLVILVVAGLAAHYAVQFAFR